MSENNEAPAYTSYLLRLRRRPAPGGEARQVMLQQVGSEEQHFFPDLEALLRFLQADRAGEEEDHME
jgi:hypothetical protein